MRSLPKLLSKTKLMRGYRCEKALWLTIQRPDLEPSITPDQQALFDQGSRVGEEARKHYPGGTLVDFPPWGFVDSLKKTRELIAAGHEVIYEAAFEYKGCYARVDIIRFNPMTRRWAVLEVKASTRVKDEHLDDVGLQAWIVANSGLPVEKIALVHLNPDCRFPDLSNLFVEQDVTSELRERYPDISPKLNSIFKALRSPEMPEIQIGPHCSRYRDCEFAKFCFASANLPEFSVLDVYLLQDKWTHFREGRVRLEDLDVSTLSELQRRITDCHLRGERFVDTSGIRTSLADWRYPLVHLDFETINPAIPCFDGCGPYQHVPFQFSVDVQDAPRGGLAHFEYLHGDASDPRGDLIPVLLEACGSTGTIVSYNAKFEMRVIEHLAEAFPEYSARLRALLPRFKDPLPLIREHVYDPAFAGRFGLKSVAPALLGEDASYVGLSVSDGAEAQRAYSELVSVETSELRKEEVRRAMLEYCAKDTRVMVDLVDWLRDQADSEASRR